MSKSIWPKIPNHFVQNMLSAHGALGVALGGLLYLICLSGTLTVFHAEFTRWEQPSIREAHEIDVQAMQAGLEAFQASEFAQGQQVRIVAPTDDNPRLMIGEGENYFFVMPDGSLGPRIEHGFSEFLVEMHMYLHLPSTLGITLVGFFGVVLLALIGTGLLAHPNIFRDAFNFRRSRSAQLAETDLHNRLSVWGAPFHITSALTGATLGLATIAGFTLAALFYEGDFNKVFPPIFGETITGSTEPAPLADIRPLVTEFTAQDDRRHAWLVHINQPGTVGQSLEILALHDDRLVYYEQYHYDSAGELTHTLGLKDGALGQQIAASLYTLHFGIYGGVWVKFAYTIMGLALTIVCVSGVNLWLIKRTQKGKPYAQTLTRAWNALVWGAPAMIAIILIISVLNLLPDEALPWVFWPGLAMITLAGGYVPDTSPVRSGLQVLTGCATIIAMGVHWAIHHESFHGVAAWSVMALCILVGFWLVGQGLVGLRPAQKQPVLETVS